MSEPLDEAANPQVDWEAFYQSYRKPGYVPGYEITSKLGGGMFGLVFKARKQSIGKDYAIKFLKVDDTEVRRAVVAELESVRHFAQVDHPNLVSIEDRGEVDGVPYIVMAYAGDDTLRERLGAEDASVEDLLLYFLQACRGVHALHERSLVHFDLKPANIFIKGSVARVGDYGLSKLMSHSRNSLSMGRGTPYYMAPEMLQQKGDARSDIYSLGVILYECVTGDVPFKGDTEWEVLRKHEKAEPEYPDGMTPQLRQVIARCLAKDPAQRFATVADIIAALGAGSASFYAAEEPTAAPVPPPPVSSDDEAQKADVAESKERLKRAAKNLSEQARIITEEAVKSARVVGGRAMRDAQRAMRRELRRQRVNWNTRKRAAVDKALKAKEEKAPWAAHLHWGRARRSYYGKSWWGPLAVFVIVMFVVMGVFMGESRHSGGETAVAISVDPGSPSSWLESVRTGRGDAKRRLQDGLDSFAHQLPTSSGTILASGQDLPDLPLRLSLVSPEVLKSARSAALQVAEGQQLAVEKLEASTYAGILAAIERLEQVDMAEEREREEAARLNEYLQSTLRFKGIRVRTDSPTRYYALNSRAGQLWRWYVHEFIPDEKTYQLYRMTVR